MLVPPSAPKLQYGFGLLSYQATIVLTVFFLTVYFCSQLTAYQNFVIAHKALFKQHITI